MDVSLVLSTTHVFWDVKLSDNKTEKIRLDCDAPRQINTSICASKYAVSGTYKVLLGAQLSDVAISKFVTVTIDPLSLLESTSAIPK